MAAEIKIIATDLDGTLIGRANEFPVYNSFREKINEMRGRNQAVWAACTGRTLRSFRHFFAPMRMMDIMPDFVVIRHAYIFGLTRVGYLPHVFWNLHILHMILNSQIYVRDAISQWNRMLTGGSMGVRTLEKKRDRLRLRFESEESASVAADVLREKARPYPQLRVFRVGTEVEVKPVPFTKGLALKELSRHLGINAENVLAVGNGHNDISMFDPDIAHFTGCPANSKPAVMWAVHQRGGHIAGKSSLTGVMEILNAYTEGGVSSQLPDWWEHSAEKDTPKTPTPKPQAQSQEHHAPRRRPRTLAVWLIAGMIYAVLLVFASFGLLGPASSAVIKPLSLLVSLLEKLTP